MRYLRVPLPGGAGGAGPYPAGYASGVRARLSCHRPGQPAWWRAGRMAAAFIATLPRGGAEPRHALVAGWSG
jgi:hypothetical protein